MVAFLVRIPFAAAITAAAVGGALSLAVSLAAVERYGADLPDHRPLLSYVPPSGSEVLAGDGSLISKRASIRRTFVPLEAIPPLVAQAFISAEDQNYRTHPGVDPVAMLRAGVSFIAGTSRSGASTITQQVAKNLLVGNERSVERKIREAILALRLDRDVGKQKVLEIYLNEIYLGMGAYGVAEASRVFFGKDLADLDVAEAALLAAMPKAPSAFDPSRNPDRARQRRDYVVRRLLEDGEITPEQAQLALSEGLGVEGARSRIASVASAGEDRGDPPAGAGWFESSAWNSIATFLKDSGLEGRDVVVRTTLSPAFQEAASAALRAGILEADHSLGWDGPLAQGLETPDWEAIAQESGFSKDQVCLVSGFEKGTALCLHEDGSVERVDRAATEWTGRSPAKLLSVGDMIALAPNRDGSLVVEQPPRTEGALVALDPRTGDVKALVGGFSYERSVFDRVMQAKRQPGSVFKPIVYLTALELGYDARSPLLDAPIVIEQGPGQEDWRPADARSAGKGGLITLRNALQASRNMASVRLLWDIGLGDVGWMASRLGVMPPEGMSYSAALGSGAVSPMQMALAYATIANGGRSIRPRFVDRIEYPDADVIADVPSGVLEQSVDPVATAQMMSVLTGVVTDGTARQAFAGFDRYLAGKTGTTNDARDVWFAAASAELVVVAWIGRDDNKPLARGSSGGRVAGTIVRDFLDRLGDDVVLEAPPLPEGVTAIGVDPGTGLESDSTDAIMELIREDPSQRTVSLQ